MNWGVVKKLSFTVLTTGLYIEWNPNSLQVSLQETIEVFDNGVLCRIAFVGKAMKQKQDFEDVSSAKEQVCLEEKECRSLFQRN